MKLNTLNPEFRKAFPVEDDTLYEMSFDCPVCGPPWRVYIKARLGGPRGPEGVWAWTAAPFGFDPSIPLDWNTVTITPSVKNQNHGRKRSCNGHFNVSDGIVQIV